MTPPDIGRLSDDIDRNIEVSESVGADTFKVGNYTGRLIATAQVEAVARALLRARKATVAASDEHWAGEMRHYHELCGKYPGYTDGGSLITDAMRDARAAIAAMHEAEAVAAERERCARIVEDCVFRIGRIHSTDIAAMIRCALAKVGGG